MKKFYSFCFVALTLLTSSVVTAQQKNYWTPSDVSNIDIRLISGPTMPTVYKIVELDDAAFRASMVGVPSETSVTVANSTKIVAFPNMEGQMERFTVVEAPVMEEGLAARYPGINSYIGKGIEDKSQIVRFDVSPYGMNAMIMSGNRGTIYIDHVQGNYYRVSSRDDFEAHSLFNCNSPIDLTNNTFSSRPSDISDASQPTLRTYKLALLSGAEFSLHFITTEVTVAEKKARVLAEQNAQMTRANGIFERDFSVRLLLCATNDSIIYLDPATDPVDNVDGPTQTTLNTAINAKIGSANYNIGHTESKSTSSANSNGNAGCIGCVCGGTTTKGKAFTSYYNPSLLDYYVVDYLTHEMGHQMGANHTFTFNNESTTVQCEPGSGITIMGYAGITGATDVSNHSIDNFHGKTIQQVTQYMYNSTGNNCAVPITTNNVIPTANAGADYTIPKSTPFALTGSGSDGDATDVVTFAWDQIDVNNSGTNVTPATTLATGPMFRTFSPKTSPTTYFPSIQYVLTGANGTTWERLAAVARTLNFRLVVRDNHGYGGGNATDNMIVTVDATSGPFAITFPATTGLSWVGNSTKTITWNVANTTAAPVSCSLVRISLSTDTFKTAIILADNVPNNGSANIIVPNTPTNKARIKVEAVGNIFFDICDRAVTITADPLPVKLMGLTATKQNQTSLLRWQTASEQNAGQFNIQRSADGIHFENSSIGNVKALGNTTSISNYSFIDASPLKKTNYYRVESVDANQLKEYSNVAMVTFGSNEKLKILSNPVSNNQLYFNYTAADYGKLSVQFFDSKGSLVAQNSLSAVAGNASYSIDVQYIPTGVYVAKFVEANGTVSTAKFYKK